jgi:hypothetical protein
MNSTLKDFFKAERNRVFEPGPYFTQRVMARLSARAPGVWDMIPLATRPVLGLALMLLFAVLAIQILMPVEPARGPIEAYVIQDLSPRERMLYIDVDVPASLPLVEWTMLEPTP